MTQQYGTVKVDVITYTSGTGGSETDQSITVSSLATISRTGIIVTGDIEANNITANSGLNVGGLADVSGLVVGHDATITGNLIVGSGIQASSLVVQNDATVSGALNVSGLATVSGLTVTGDTSLNTLTVTGTINASGVNISGFTGLFDDGTAASPSITFAADQDTGFYRPGDNQVAISTSGAGRVFVNTSGFVGIGTSSPVEKLTVETGNVLIGQNTGANTGIRNYLKFGRTNFGAKAAIGFINDEDYGRGSILFMNDPAGDDDGFDDADEVMRITSTGFVAIGQSTATQKLSVNGNVVATAPSGTPVWMGPNNAATGAAFLLQQSATENTLESSASIPMRIGTVVSQNLSLKTENTNRLFINPSGNIGLSTDSPTCILQIDPTYGLPTTVNTEAIAVNVGLPVTSGGGTFNRLRIGSRRIVESGNTGSQAELFLRGSRGGIGFDYGSGGGGIATQLNYSTDSFATQTAAVTVKNDGDVGVGTISPDSRLEVKHDGSGEVSVLRVVRANGGNTRVFRIDIDPANRAINYAATGNQGCAHVWTQGTSGTEKARIDINGALLIATSTARAISSTTSKLQLEGVTNYGNASMSITHNRNDDGSPLLHFCKSRGTTAGSNALVSNNDRLGRVTFHGTDGTQALPAARIDAYVDGPTASGVVPGRLVFATTASGNSTPTPQMAIKTDGNVGIGTTTPECKLDILLDNTGNTVRVQAGRNNLPYTTYRAATGSYVHVGYNPTLNAMTFTQGSNPEGSDPMMAIKPAGNVGIGVGNPTEKLQVDSGDVLIGQSTGASSGVRNYLKFGRRSGAKAGLGFINTLSNGRGALLFMNSNVSDGNGFTDTDERMRLTQDGKLGINTSNPGSYLSISTTTQPNSIDVSGNGKGSIFLSNSGGTQGENQLGNGIGFSRINTSRRGAMIASYQPTTDADQCGLAFYTKSSTTTSTDAVSRRMVINHNGAVIIGTSTVPNGEKFYTNQVAGFQRGSDGQTVRFYRSTTQVGSISVTTSATAYNETSDYRLKENVVAISDGISRVKQLKPSRFNFIAEPSQTIDGFLAHEIQTVVPEAASGEKDAVDADGKPIMQQLDKSKLIPLLTAALQECIKKVETLEAEVASLKAGG